MPSPEFLELKRRRTVGVILQMQKNACGVHGGGGFRQRWLGGEGFGAGKLWKKIGGFIPAGGEAAVESAEVGTNVIGIGAKSIDAMTIPEDQASEDSGGMCGVGWDE